MHTCCEEFSVAEQEDMVITATEEELVVTATEEEDEELVIYFKREKIEKERSHLYIIMIAK